MSDVQPTLREHLPWIATLAGFAYATLKVAIVSGGDFSVARGVVATSSLPTLLLGVAMLALPMLLAIVAFVSTVVALASMQTKTRMRGPLCVAVPSYALLTVLAPIQALFASLSIAGAVTLALSFDKGRKFASQQLPKEISWASRVKYLIEHASPRRRVLAMVAVCSLLVPFWTNGLSSGLDRSVWLPLELACVSADKESLMGEFVQDATNACTAATYEKLAASKRLTSSLGYVLQSGGEWTTLLLEKQRRLIVVPTKSMVARVGCRSPDIVGLTPLFRSLIAPDAADDTRPIVVSSKYECYPAILPSTQAPSQYKCQGVPATKVGTLGKDAIEGTHVRDVIQSIAGDDLVVGIEGDDLICGDRGDDRLSGDIGTDRLFGESGHDELYGSIGDDQVVGNAGNDRLAGGTGNDDIMGDTGNDRLDGGPGFDVCSPGRGTDVVVNCERVVR